MTDRWIRGPIGPGAERRVTRANCRTVLVMVPTMAAGNRVADVLSLLSGDHRIQTLYTVPDTNESWHGTAESAAAGGGLVIPWHQALNHRFDLVLSASYTGLCEVRGKILVLPHGASSLMSRKYSRNAGRPAVPHIGLSRETLTFRGRLVPAALALPHDAELHRLRESCPEALPVAVVAGDICHDRMVAGLPRRAEYRCALGVAEHQKLVTVSSTWSTESAFGMHPNLCRQLVTEAAKGDYKVALVLHPGVWAVHGRWQVMTWLSDCVENGLLVIPPEEGWRATVIASDYVIGDHGSTTQYAAAIGKQVLLAAYPENSIRAGSLADAVAATAPRVDHSRPILPQLPQAKPASGEIARLLTSRPGQAATILRRTIYRLLDLGEPARAAYPIALPLPAPMMP
jgi:hypothetical protein